MPASGGYIITTNVANVKKIDCDEAWLIARAGKDIPGTIRVRSLAPSPHLYKIYFTEWRQRDPEEWWPQYRAEFARELQSAEKLNKLRELWSLVNVGRVIALVCYCKDANHCHRLLVGQFMMNQGVRVEEFSKLEMSSAPEGGYRQMNLF
jgi:uncharacterized protein YeaO (DUF488 family)